MILKYNGYIGKVELDQEAQILYGHVEGIKDIITFQGQTVTEIIQAFHDSVEDYLDMCKKYGKKAQRSFSGNLRIRIDPRLHERLTNQAITEGKSLNTLISEKLHNVH